LLARVVYRPVGALGPPLTLWTSSLA